MDDCFVDAITCEYYCDRYGRNCYHLTYEDGSTMEWVEEDDL